MKWRILILSLVLSSQCIVYGEDFTERRTVAIVPFGARERDWWIAEELSWAMSSQLAKLVESTEDLTLFSLAGEAPGPDAFEAVTDKQRAAALADQLEQCRRAGVDLLVAGWVTRRDNMIEASLVVLDVARETTIERISTQRASFEALYNHVPEMANGVLGALRYEDRLPKLAPNVSSSPTLEFALLIGVSLAVEQSGLVRDAAGTLYDTNQYSNNEFQLAIEANLVYRRALGVEVLLGRGWLRSWETDSEGSRTGSIDRLADVTTLKLGLFTEIVPLPIDDIVYLRLSVGALHQWISFRDDRMWINTDLDANCSSWGTYADFSVILNGPIMAECSVGLLHLLDAGVVLRQSTPLYLMIGVGIRLVR